MSFDVMEVLKPEWWVTPGEVHYVVDPSNVSEYEWGTHIDFLERWKYMFWASAILYPLSVFALYNFMKSRQAWDCTTWKLFHNGVFCIFSTVGGVYTTWFVVDVVIENNFNFNAALCGCYAFVHKNVGWWAAIFCTSKIFELPETIVICLEKKPLIFLHYYHHLMTFLFCWFTSLFPPAAGIIFTTLNYDVHAIMYLYYFLATYNGKAPNWSKFVTLIQLLQMFIGVWAIIINMRDCPNYFFGSVIGLAMYVSYAYLFADLFYKKYLSGKSQKRERPVAAGIGSAVATATATPSPKIGAKPFKNA